ncbi:preprotein translocase subunit YajC [Pedobacter endophyticus]|uniref:Sec translocon accessory complex subunit YajC n=1 Tax=Pedobacter endophyticus TaxID=2789740 RepID=A0A7S9KZ23_9SPHI|nr:preprotein translocase subunit YajC [Pedobacter endophyticus]QPH39480.1 preprotein translocase subunit YajC [Pedobacter endophyticus]
MTTTTIILDAPGGFGQYGQLIMLGAIALVFYFFMIRPQVKKAKDHKKLISELKKGDKVITTAGIHGRIIDMNEATFLIEVESGAKIRFDKSAVSLDATKAVVAPAKA